MAHPEGAWRAGQASRLVSEEDLLHIVSHLDVELLGGGREYLSGQGSGVLRPALQSSIHRQGVLLLPLRNRASGKNKHSVRKYSHDRDTLME